MIINETDFDTTLLSTTMGLGQQLGRYEHLQIYHCPKGHSGYLQDAPTTVTVIYRNMSITSYTINKWLMVDSRKKHTINTKNPKTVDG